MAAVFGKRDSDEAAQGFRRAAQYLGLGSQLAGAVVGFGLLGYWIDVKAGTGSLWTTILLFAGAIGGMYSFLRSVIRLGKEQKKQSDTHDD